MKIFQYTNKGSREENQDFVIHGSLPDNSAIFVVADGMGGYSDGATASKVVSEAIYDFIEMNYLQYTFICKRCVNVEANGYGSTEDGMCYHCTFCHRRQCLSHLAWR